MPTFTDLAVQKLPEGLHFDEKLKNFAIRVGKNRKTWIVVKGENRTKVTLGHYPAMTLAEARKSAMTALSSASQQKTRISFPEAVEAFLALPRWRQNSKRVLTSSLKHFKWTRQLDRITHEDVVQALAVIEAPSARAHALKDIKTFFNWTIPRHLQVSPVSGIKMETQKSRERVLTDDEIKALWKHCEGTFGIIFKLLLLTGQRKTEIGMLRSEYINDDLITLPSSLVKNGRQHTFPIGPLAHSLLPQNDKGYLFTATKGDDHYNGYAYHLAQLQKASGVTDFTIHDARRSWSTRAAELGVSIAVAEKVLNHVSGTHSGVQAIYNKFSYLKEQREAMLTIEQSISTLVGAKA